VLHTAKKYEEAAQSFHALLKMGMDHEMVYRYAISSYLETKDYTTATTLCEEFMSAKEMTSDDYATAALAYSKCGEHDRSIVLYDKSLELDANNKYALNNKGYTLNLLNRFEEAIPLFDRAIALDKVMAYPYNNRGLAKIKTGREQEGLDEIHHSFKLDGTNSYCYLNLGIYHLDKGEHSKALEFFNKAKAMDDTTLGVDEFISRAESGMS
jgi:Tfp pilus assembly protein PilF